MRAVRRFSLKIATMTLIALLGGGIAACTAQQLASPPQEEPVVSQAASQGRQPWSESTLEELLAKIPEEKLKEIVEEPFQLIGPGGQVILIPRPPMDRETSFRLLWEANRRAWAKITQRFDALLAGEPDHRFLNDPAFKARMREEDFQLLADELRRVIAEWERAKSSSHL